MPTWAQLIYLICAICFILALKGLSGPKTARTGNLIGAAAAVVACALPFFYVDDMQNIVNILTLMTSTEGERLFAPDFDDEIVAGSCVTHAGEIRHAPTREALEGSETSA